VARYNFDQIVDHGAINASKWNVAEGIIPMSIADTDFLSPPEISEAIRDRIAVESYGYSRMTDADYDAIRNWIGEHQGQHVPREHLLATPGVLYTMRAVLYALTDPGDSVIVQTPLHTTSIRSAALRDSVLIKNEMKSLPDGPWTVLDAPVLPLEEQIENSSLYHEESNGWWFLFTNHVGIDGTWDEWTDAIWVYWSRDPTRWKPANRAVVLDGHNCAWSKQCIGMPSAIKVGERLALLYDAPGGERTDHMERDIGLAWLDLPLSPPGGDQQRFKERNTNT